MEHDKKNKKKKFEENKAVIESDRILLTDPLTIETNDERGEKGTFTYDENYLNICVDRDKWKRIKFLEFDETQVLEESDPVFLESEAYNITATDVTNLSNLSGTNTGDQDLSPYWKNDGTATATGNWNIQPYRIFASRVGVGTSNIGNDLLQIYQNSASTLPLQTIYNIGAGDSVLDFKITGDQYNVGIDNTDDNFKINWSVSGTQLGSNDRFIIDGRNSWVSLPQDNEYLYFGAAKDGSLVFTGTGLILKSNNVGAGDFLQLQGGTNGINFVIGTTEQITLTDGVLRPTTDNDIDIGTSSQYFKDAYLKKTKGYMEAEGLNILGSARDSGGSAGFHVHMASESYWGMLFYNDTYGSETPIFSYYGHDSGKFSQGTEVNTDLAFYTNGFSNERMVIKAGGDVELSHTIKPSGGYKSADGTAGITTTFLDADGNTIGVKNGLIVSKTAP
jgi:hypothetical protein